MRIRQDPTATATAYAELGQSCKRISHMQGELYRNPQELCVGRRGCWGGSGLAVVLVGVRKVHYMFTDYLQHKTYENLQQLLQKLLQPTSKTTANEQRLRTSSRSYPITPTKGNRHEGTRRIRACVGLKPRRNVRWSRRFRHVTTSLSWDRSKRRSGRTQERAAIGSASRAPT